MTATARCSPLSAITLVEAFSDLDLVTERKQQPAVFGIRFDPASTELSQSGRCGSSCSNSFVANSPTFRTPISDCSSTSFVARNRSFPADPHSAMPLHKPAQQLEDRVRDEQLDQDRLGHKSSQPGYLARHTAQQSSTGMLCGFT